MCGWASGAAPTHSNHGRSYSHLSHLLVCESLCSARSKYGPSDILNSGDWSQPARDYDNAGHCPCLQPPDYFPKPPWYTAFISTHCSNCVSLICDTRHCPYFSVAIFHPCAWKIMPFQAQCLVTFITKWRVFEYFNTMKIEHA